jgi:hypothetical protein
MKRILICDDESRSLERWEKQLKRVLRQLNIDATVESIRSREELTEAIAGLDERRRRARGRRASEPKWQPNRFDPVDILIVDYDLLKLTQDGSMYVTGENVAYLCRCYSRCGLIVALNQYGMNPFDLTLKGHPESYADINLGSEQIANPGLWAQGWTGFRPWYWPLLPLASEALSRRCKALVGHLDDKILAYLEFPEEVIRALPRSTREFLGRTRRPEESTFRDFVIESGNGLRPKDKPWDDTTTARIAGARLGKWLDRLVLSGQDILVDGPHLALRYPSLLNGPVSKIASWNRTASFQQNRTGLRDEHIKASRFKKHDWVSKPSWFWRALSANEKIDEVSRPWVKEQPTVAFCEDLSRFLPSDQTREFVADLSSNFVRRSVANPSFAARKLASELRRVDYQPSVRFSL